MKHTTIIIVIMLCVLQVVVMMSTAETEKEVIVTAVREQRATWEVPADITVITAEQIKKMQAVTVADVLSRSDGIYMRSGTGNSATMEISMRGFGENSHGRVLVLLNGHRLNEPDMLPPNLFQIPVANIERIEILHGGASALYGDYATAGVINIVTKKGAGPAKFTVSADAGSWGFNSQHIITSGTLKDVGYVLNANRIYSDGYRNRNEYETWGVNGAFDWSWTEKIFSSADIAWSHVAYQMPGWLSKAQMEENPRQSLNPADEAQNDFGRVSISIIAGEPDQRFNLRISASSEKREADMTSWSSFSTTRLTGMGLFPQYVVKTKIGEYDSSWLLGIDVSTDTLNTDRYADATRTGDSQVNAEVERKSAGVYLRNETTLGELCTIVSSVRGETYKTSADVNSVMGPNFDENKTRNEYAFELAMIKSLDDKSKIFVRSGRVYRYPFVDEQVSYIGFGTDAFYGDLKPETGWNSEAGMELNIDDNLSCRFVVFMLHMKDEIAWDYVTMRNQNLDNTLRHGGELAITYSPSEVCTMRAFGTVVDAEFTSGSDDGKDVPLVPAYKAGLELQLGLGNGLMFDSVATFTGKSRLGGDRANIAPQLDDYIVINAFLRYAPSFVNGLEAYIGVENVFDEKYATLGYVGLFEDGYYPAPGRSFRGGITLQF